MMPGIAGGTGGHLDVDSEAFNWVVVQLDEGMWDAPLVEVLLQVNDGGFSSTIGNISDKAEFSYSASFPTDEALNTHLAEIRVGNSQSAFLQFQESYDSAQLEKCRTNSRANGDDDHDSRDGDHDSLRELLKFNPPASLARSPGRFNHSLRSLISKNGERKMAKALHTVWDPA
jgi:hypothetical protein